MMFAEAVPQDVNVTALGVLLFGFLLVACGMLLGLAGVLLALPLVVVLQVVCEQVVVKELMDRWV